MRRWSKLLTYALGASAALMAACLLSACGSSSSQGSTSASGAQPLASTSGTSTKANRDMVTDGSATQQPLHGTGGDEVNDDNPGHADTGDVAKVGKNPCALVPKAEAQTILGGPITPVEAPLGPTCIYTAAGPKRTVTVSVEGVDFNKIKPKIHMRARFAVGGRPAYCGIYGQSATFVPLAGGGVLNVTGPCAIGRRFAEQAMARL